MKKLLLFLLPLLLIFSCTVQKRKYQNGYYVSWHAKNSGLAKDQVANKAPKVSVTTNSQIEAPISVQDLKTEALASSENKLIITAPKKPINFFGKLPNDSCDVIIFKDGSEIKGKVIEVLADQIKYKRCDTPDGPSYISRKSELFMIKYSNGTREVIKSEEPVRQVQKYNTYDQQKNKNAPRRRQVDPLAIAALVFGILALVSGYVFLNLILYATGPLVLALILLSFFSALIAVITGKTSLNRIRENADMYKGKGLAMPGFIFGLVVLGIYALILMLVFLSL